MKIGILTHPPRQNYGGILQAYALQIYLQCAGHEIWILDRQKKVQIPAWRLFLGVLKRCVLKYVFGRHIALTIQGNRRRSDMICRNTREFVSRYIHLTSPAYTSEDLARQVSELRFDAVIVGSDQVWRPCYVASITDYFLGFLPENSRVKRIAYAASFGVADWEFTEKQTQICRSLISRFDAISVRETSGVELCKNYFGVNASHLLDPTLLLKPADYLSLVSAENKNTGSHLFVYILDSSDDKQAVVDRVLAHEHLQPYQIKVQISDISLPVDERQIPSVEDWLRGFRDAGFVVTDSFHGCVFSILFNKPFIVYGNRERGMTRFHSLLAMFHLGNRFVNSSDEVSEELFGQPIGWEKVNRILNEQREFADCFLKTNLGT